MGNMEGFGIVRLKAETTLNDQLPSAPGSWDHTLETEDWGFDPTLETFPRETMKAGHYVKQAQEGTKGGTLTLRGPVVGFSATAPSADPTEHYVAALLRSVMGAAVQSGYAATAVDSVASSTPTAVQVDSGTAASTFKMGAAIGLTDGTDNRVGFITNIADGGGAAASTLTMLTALGLTPSSSTDIKGSNTVYLSTADHALPQSWTVELQPEQAANRIIVGGWIPTQLTLSMTNDEAGGVWTWEASGPVADWDEISGAAPSSYQNTLPLLPNAVQENGARLVVGTTSPSDLDVEQISIVFDSPWRYTKSLNSRQARSGARVNGMRTVTMTYRQLVDASNTYETSLPTSGPVTLQIGNTWGAIMAICLPNPVCNELPGHEVADGLRSQGYTWQQNYFGDDNTSADAGNSEARVAFL